MLKNTIYREELKEEYPLAVVGSLDQCIPIILPLLFNELIGELDEEKDFFVMMRKDPEYHKRSGYECFELIGSFIDFK